MVSLKRTVRSLLPGFVLGLGAGLALHQWRRVSHGAELDRRRLEGEAESERLRLRLATVQSGPADAEHASPPEAEAEPALVPGFRSEATAGEGATAIGTPGSGRVDDLQRIKGIGPVMERSLNELGIRSWEQLANLTPADVERLTAAISAFPGRIERDDWVGSARRLLDAEQHSGPRTS